MYNGSSTFDLNGNRCGLAVRDGWRKSSRSGASGAEVAAWRKSSYCQSGECVEVGQAGEVVVVRGTKNPGPVLTFPAAVWEQFTAKVKR